MRNSATHTYLQILWLPCWWFCLLSANLEYALSHAANFLQIDSAPGHSISQQEPLDGILGVHAPARAGGFTFSNLPAPQRFSAYASHPTGFNFPIHRLAVNLGTFLERHLLCLLALFLRLWKALALGLGSNMRAFGFADSWQNQAHSTT